MRSACRLTGAGVAICLLCLGGASAGTRESRIRLGDVEVRSGPSNNFYATSKLHHGDVVTVVEEKDGWLAIKPPAPGRDSFSWIEAPAGQQQGRTFIVTVVQTRVRIGSSLVNQPPSVEGVTLTRGTQLYVIGPARSSPDGTWLPIVPAPTEVRYIPANTVQNVTLAPSTPPPPIVQGQGSRPDYGSTSGESKTILAQAEQAEKAERYSEALALYDQLARQALATDYDLAVKYQNRIQWIHDKQRASTAAPSLQGTNEHQDGRMAGSPVANAGYAAAIGSYNQVASGTPADPRYTVRLVPPAVNNSPAFATPGQWYEPGWLVRTTLVADEDHRPIYRYVPLSGHTWAYVTAGQNVGLEPYVNRIVTFFGNMQYHSTLRYWYLDVQQVSMQQQ